MRAWGFGAGLLIGCACSPLPPPKFYGRVCTQISDAHREWILKCSAGKTNDPSWVEECAYQAEKLFCPLTCFQYESYDKVACDDPEWKRILESE